MKLEGQFWITHNGKNLAGQSRIELLTQIANSGSITQAAKAVGISYKSAWDAVEAMNSAAGSPLVARSTGGKGGGGTQLTAAGQQLIEAFQHYQREHQAFLLRLGADSRLGRPQISVASFYGSVFPAVQNLLLGCRAVGLGASLQTLPIWNIPAARKILGLPRGVNPVCIIPIGWARGKYGPTTRRPIGEVVHLDRYGNQPFR